MSRLVGHLLPEFVAARKLVEHAHRDLDDDAQVGIATGLLMVNEACTVEQAERLLQSAATPDEKTILEIAHRIVDQHHPLSPASAWQPDACEQRAGASVIGGCNRLVNCARLKQSGHGGS